MGFNSTPDFDVHSRQNQPLQNLPSTDKPTETVKGKDVSTLTPYQSGDTMASTMPKPDLNIPSPVTDVPDLPHPLSTKKLSEATEHFIKSGEPIVQSKKPLNMQAVAARFKKDLASPKPPDSSLPKNMNGAALFDLLRSQFAKVDYQQQTAENNYENELNQLTLAQLQQLNTQVEAYEALASELANIPAEEGEDQATIAKQEAELVALAQQLFGSGIFGSKSSWNPDAWQEFNNWINIGTGNAWDWLKQADPAAFAAMQQAMANYDPNNPASQVAFLQVVMKLWQTDPAFQQAFQVPMLTQADIDELNTIAAKFNSANSQISAAQADITNCQNNQGVFSNEITQDKNQFIAALAALGITNIEGEGGLEELMMQIKAMYQLKLALEKLAEGNFSGSNALELFTIAKNALCQQSQNNQSLFAQDIQNADSFNVATQELIQSITASMTQEIQKVNDLNNTASMYEKLIITLTILSIVFTIAAFFCPPLAVVAAACGLALGALMIANGVTEYEISEDMRIIANDKEQIATLSSQSQCSQEIAQNMTQNIVSMIKTLQETQKDADQVFANVNAALPQAHAG